MLAESALALADASDVWGVDEQLVTLLDDALPRIGDSHPTMRARLNAALG